jgi:hypothetical protein
MRFLQIICPFLAVFTGFGLIPGVEAMAAEPSAGGRRVEGAPSLQGVTYSIFDNATGARTGRLKIDRVDFEYRRRGFMVVGWHPQVVLDGVSLEIEAGMSWQSQGSQIIRALCSHGRRDDIVLRRLRVRLAEPEAREIVAAQARLTATGALEMLQAGTPASDGSVSADTSYVLPLTGPQAGQLQRTAPSGGRPDRDNFHNGNIQN